VKPISLALHELIPEFYVKLGADYRARLLPGQICTAPVLYSYENQGVWRPLSLDGSGTSATYFQQISKPGDAYSQNSILHSPKLGAHEEFPVVRAKKRPVIVLIPQQSEL
jgi:hypothetical protein